jgi:hypothetical protein
MQLIKVEEKKMRFLQFVLFLMLLIFFVLLSVVIRASNAPDLIEEPDMTLLKQTGKLFTVEFSKMGRHIVVRAAGNEAVIFDGRDISIFGHVFSGSQSESDLHVARDPQSVIPKYNVLDPLNQATALELDVKDTKKGSTEHFKFKLN